eukprot:jgi/Mesen1/7106/ME000369S06437
MVAHAQPPGSPPGSSASPSLELYSVQWGDWAVHIARRHRISLEHLRSLNPGVDLDKLGAKQKLWVPKLAPRVARSGKGLKAAEPLRAPRHAPLPPAVGPRHPRPVGLSPAANEDEAPAGLGPTDTCQIFDQLGTEDTSTGRGQVATAGGSELDELGDVVAPGVFQKQLQSPPSPLQASPATSGCMPAGGADDHWANRHTRSGGAPLANDRQLAAEGRDGSANSASREQTQAGPRGETRSQSSSSNSSSRGESELSPVWEGQDGEGGGGQLEAFYMVLPGDSLTSIAARHDVSMEDMMRANSLSYMDTLTVGQLLALPRRSQLYHQVTGGRPPLPAQRLRAQLADELWGGGQRAALVTLGALLLFGAVAVLPAVKLFRRRDGGKDRKTPLKGRKLRTSVEHEHAFGQAAGGIATGGKATGDSHVAAHRQPARGELLSAMGRAAPLVQSMMENIDTAYVRGGEVGGGRGGEAAGGGLSVGDGYSASWQRREAVRNAQRSGGGGWGKVDPSWAGVLLVSAPGVVAAASTAQGGGEGGAQSCAQAAAGELLARLNDTSAGGSGAGSGEEGSELKSLVAVCGGGGDAARSAVQAGQHRNGGRSLKQGSSSCAR